MTASPVAPVFPPAPDYVPFRAGPFRLLAGLQPLDLQDWIEIDGQFASELAEKERLLRERHHEVFAVFPEALASSMEVLELLAAHLPMRFPTLYRDEGDLLCNLVTQQRWSLSQQVLHPLDLAGRLVQEDLCLMRHDLVTDTYRLVGASLCFPTRWRLVEKMGHALTAIHAPVVGYEEQLAVTVDRFFDRLKVEKPVWRLNWGLIDDQRHRSRITTAFTIIDRVGDGRDALGNGRAEQPVARAVPARQSPAHRSDPCNECNGEGQQQPQQPWLALHRRSAARIEFHQAIPFMSGGTCAPLPARALHRAVRPQSQPLPSQLLPLPPHWR